MRSSLLLSSSPSRAVAGGVWILFAGCLVLGCGEADGPLSQCLATKAEAADEASAATCAAAFEATGDLRAAAAAARIAYRRERLEELRGWLDRLPAERAEAGLWSLAADLYLRAGQGAEALEAYRRDLPRQEAAGDQAGAASSHYGLSYLYWQRTEYRPALEHAALALEGAARAGDRGLVAVAAQGLYAVLSAVGDLDAAQAALHRAAELADPADGTTQAALLAHRGNLLLDRGLPALARASIEGALARPDAPRDPRFARAAHLNLVRAALDLGELAPAREHLGAAQAAIEPGRETTALLYYRALVERAEGQAPAAEASLRRALEGEPRQDWRWQLLDELGRALEEQGQRAAAIRAFEQAAEAVEAMRRELELDELKAWLLVRKRHPFEALFRLQAGAGRFEAALATAERASSRSFFDRFIASARTEGPAPSPAAAADRLEALEGLLPALARSPTAALRPTAELLAALRGQACFVFFETEDELWRLDVLGGRATARRLGSRDEVKELVAAMVTKPASVDAAARLGGLLWPGGTRVAAGQVLYLVVSGPLAELPFAALVLEKRRLVELHPLLYAPSLTALASRLERRPSALGPPQVLGDPGGDLPAAAAEATEVAALLGVEAQVGRAASRTALAASTGAALLHVAAHSGSGARGPWLQLADGRLTAGEILTLSPAPRLVVLASCAGADRRGSELAGALAGSFLAAGSTHVLASLWSLPDEPARDLVLRFYRHGGATDPATALWRLQAAAANAGEDPALWAPLVLFGGPGALPQPLENDP